ncbi:Holliday junction branch migration protein RuvA [Anaerotruncus sp. 1XD42-93]|uniref:Holliday junction branch migration protein RuvA n=1 Tax=Anaerotruncus sp. 1XD42-93 TaxID=2320853 RepID=UPI000EA1FB92|nr:Holliday junction branch migration protein RuvA [Anaerotruncus sp. 1XD42-93]MCI9159961.1 Holliday junction branch migration protein RuvA [Anaerotruncus sp.]NBK17837.1 Holliday junction branch migration protein RuvA [Anaerotruncus sp. 1XD42-93]NCE75731.1 Holliday junction branch migration protein RuvA [Anaerotruncus sp. X29]RKJ93789.1 Holliday junction branch migration protein RuvA [Anaerotruncus sp. 1XD22-93]
MFYSLTGKLIHTEAYLAVVECGGVGYRCMTSLTTLSCLPPAGERVTLYTHLNVREDALDLFGFYSMNELDAFKKLIGVSGVGPKSALAILSDMTPDRLALCIASGDAKSLTRAPGVGVKLAQRLILELKDKISKAELASGVGEAAVQIGADGSGMNEAAAALCTLGYSQSQAAEALAGLAADLPVDELIRQALKKVARL